MQLTSDTKNFFKFEHEGDEISGKFVSYTPDVPGKFGPENQLMLDVDGSVTMVRCQAHLAQIFKANGSKIKPGDHLKIKFSGKIPTGKGQPMKKFDVRLNEDTNSGTKKADENLDFPPGL